MHEAQRLSQVKSINPSKNKCYQCYFHFKSLKRGGKSFSKVVKHWYQNLTKDEKNNKIPPYVHPHTCTTAVQQDLNNVCFFCLFVCFVFLSFCYFLVRSASYGGSQAMGRIGAVAAGLRHTSNLHHSTRQRHILNPLNEAGDWTCILMDAGRVC